MMSIELRQEPDSFVHAVSGDHKRNEHRSLHEHLNMGGSVRLCELQGGARHMDVFQSIKAEEVSDA